MSLINTEVGKLKVIVISGKYSEILPQFAQQFNKYFSAELEVIVLSPKDISGLPENFSHHKIPFTKYWCNDVREFFSTLEDEFFLGCMEDHFLYSKVDLGLLAEIIETFKDPNVIKFCGTRHTLQPSAIWDRATRDLYQYKHTDFLYDAPVKQSLMPGIWRTEFFNYMLEQSVDWNAWEFEFRGNNYHLEPHILEHVQDKRVLFSYDKELYSMSDVIRGGQPGRQYWEQVVKLPEDIAVFEEATRKVFPNG
jgi:hypothetical protein